MSTIPASALPPPSVFERSYDPGFLGSPDGPLFFGATADDDLCTTAFTLTWSDKPRAVANAIWRHYLEHGVGAFDWTPPGDAQAIKVRWLNAPQISHTSPTTASVTGELEQLLAHS